MTDRISLSNMTFYGYHGVYTYEQEHGQRFFVDVEMKANLEQAAKTDDLYSTIDYTAVYDSIKQIVETEKYQLMEAVCGRIAGAVLTFPLVEEVTVRVRKPGTPLPGAIDYVQVELKRKR